MRFTKLGAALVTLALLFTTAVSFANSEDLVTDLQNKINEYTQKLQDLGKSKSTLSNQIKILDSQISLTLLKISQIENSVKTLESDIASLTTKINDLDVNLNQLSSIYIAQVNENYKLQKRFPPFAFLLAGNFNDFLARYKYVSTVQKNNQNTLLNLETARTNYDIQKEEKEKKQQELEALQKSLAREKDSLNKQKGAKDLLLTQTKNDEKTYQKLLSDAMQQLSQLRNFASSNGGNSCLSASPGGGSDGWFMSQRDPRWCRQIINNSRDQHDTIGEVGCFITSVSMIWKKYGFDMSPSLYAIQPQHFLVGTAWMSNPEPPPGYSYRQVAFSQSTLDNELKNGSPVIAQISMKSISGMHFIVIKGGSSGQYTINDPWYGADLNFSDHYSTSQILSLRLIDKN